MLSTQDKDQIIGSNPPSLRTNDKESPARSGNVSRGSTSNTSSGNDMASSSSFLFNASQRTNFPVTAAGLQGNPDSCKPALFVQKPGFTPTLRPSPPSIARSALSPLDNFQSLISLFPDLERSLLVAIARHEFSPRDLWRLDCRVDTLQRNKELTSSVSVPSAAGAKAVSSVTDLQRFPTLPSLLIPLTSYFRVLQMSLLTTLMSRTSHIASFTSATIFASTSLQAYMAHLADVTEHYEWDAVLAYHLAFHERCRSRMAVARGQGQEVHGYREWGTSDGELMASCLFGRAKQRPNAMRNHSVKRRRSVNAAERQATIPSTAPRMIVTPPISAAMKVTPGVTSSIVSSTAVAKSNESSNVKTDCPGENKKKMKAKQKKPHK